VTFDTAAFELGAIAADAVALAELHGGTGHEQVRIEWLQRRLEHAPGSRSVDNVGNLVWTFGPPPYRLAVLVHVDDVFDAATVRGITQRDGWLCGPRARTCTRRPNESAPTPSPPAPSNCAPSWPRS
jgi:hypothetical protein